MPRRNCTIAISAIALAVVAASMPVRAQITPDISNDLGRPSWDRLSRTIVPRPIVPWTDAPTPQIGSSFGGMTQLQAMNSLRAAGFTDVMPPDPTSDGGWSGLASWQGSKVRVRLDPEGRIAIND